MLAALMGKKVQSDLSDPTMWMLRSGEGLAARHR